MSTEYFSFDGFHAIEVCAQIMFKINIDREQRSKIGLKNYSFV